MFNDTLYQCPDCQSNNILEQERGKTQAIACACGKTFSREEGFCQLLRSTDPMVLGAVTSHSVIYDDIIISTLEPVSVKLPHKIWRVRQILTDPSEGVDTCFIDQERFSIVVSKERLARSDYNMKVNWFVFANLSPPNVLWEGLLGDAFTYHCKDAFDVAIIYAITALDTELSEATRWLATKGSRSTLTDKMTAFTQAIGQNERMSLKPLLKRIRTSIKIRNRLVHNRKELETRPLTWDDSIGTITSVYRMIKHVHRFHGGNG